MTLKSEIIEKDPEAFEMVVMDCFAETICP